MREPIRFGTEEMRQPLAFLSLELRLLLIVTKRQETSSQLALDRAQLERTERCITQNVNR